MYLLVVDTYGLVHVFCNISYGLQLGKFTRLYCTAGWSSVSFPVVFKWVCISWLCVFAGSIPAS